MARTSEWSAKVLALLQQGNSSAAIAQIKVAPTTRDLTALRAAMIVRSLRLRWPDVDTAIDDNLAALSAPRLHRSP